MDKEKFAQDLNFESWAGLIKYQAGRFAAARNGFDLGRPRPTASFEAGHVLVFEDGSAYIDEPTEVWAHFSDLAREYPEFAAKFGV